MNLLHSRCLRACFGYSCWLSYITLFSKQYLYYSTCKPGVAVTSHICIIYYIIIIILVLIFCYQHNCLLFTAIRHLTLRPASSACIPPPDLVSSRPPVPDVTVTLLCDQQNLLFALHSDFLSLVDHARVYGERVARHLDLDCSFVELIPRLYVNISTEVLDWQCHLISHLELSGSLVA